MRIFVLAFAFGIWLLQQQPALPDGSRLAGLVAGALVLLFLGRRCEKSAVTLRRPIGSAMLAGAEACLSFAWAGGFAHLRLAQELPPGMEGRDIELVGVVAGLPQELERGVRYEFDGEQAPMMRLNFIRKSVAPITLSVMSRLMILMEQTAYQFHILPLGFQFHQ